MSTNPTPTRSDILQTMIAYDRGERQKGRGKARSWFVQGPDGRKYPAKHIWGLATGVKKFQTHTQTEILGATSGLNKLGFTVINNNEPASAFDQEHFTNQMVNTIVSTVRQANGQTVKRKNKNKDLKLSKKKLAEHIVELPKSQSNKCALTGLPLNFSQNSGDDQLRPSADRIDSYGHYQKGNIQIVCKFVNFWKGSQEDGEFRRLLSLLKNT